MKNVQWKYALLLSTLLTTSVSYADQVILDDLIVNKSECIGMDCVNGEVFGFSTLKLKENNLRINFTDTSSSASFPSNDWQITINDSANGGANYFSIDNVTGDTPLFRISPSGTIAMGLELADTFVLSPTGDLNIKGTLSDSSDVNLKENFQSIDSNKMLQQINKLPITTWNYKDNAQKDRHIGAMAQDFYKEFEFGVDNRHISPKDAAFVAMVGVKELAKEIRKRDDKIQDLENKLADLEMLVKKLLLKN